MGAQQTEGSWIRRNAGPYADEVLVRRTRQASAGEPVRVLALHGLAGTDTVWRDCARIAAPEVEFWAALMPWGAAGKETWSHRGDPAAWIGQALDAVPGGVDVLIAHSFSTGLALESLAAMDRAVRPGAAVIVAPFHRRSPQDFAWHTATHYLNSYHGFLDECLRIGSRRPLDDDVRRDMALRVRDRVGAYGFLRFFETYLRSPFLDTAALDLPVLVVAGDGDPFAPLDDARGLAAALPDARLRVFQDCGHLPMEEQPQGFAAAVDDLIRETFPSAG
ncbi:alpha/beta fold hydrolase [Streptomyces sp. NPDC056257]|uniref:alpha/beta fold hydrolase n=1 Tax=Streptomyces sp. NPDC056257 TaxID=3345765 RepID=UPI0035D5F34F